MFNWKCEIERGLGCGIAIKATPTMSLSHLGASLGPSCSAPDGAPC